jgi:hypothetical protein
MTASVALADHVARRHGGERSREAWLDPIPGLKWGGAALLGSVGTGVVGRAAIHKLGLRDGMMFQG